MRQMDPSLKSVTALVVTALDTAIPIWEPIFIEAFIHSLIHRVILFLCPGMALRPALGT